MCSWLSILTKRPGFASISTLTILVCVPNRYLYIDEIYLVSTCNVREELMDGVCEEFFSLVSMPCKETGLS